MLVLVRFGIAVFGLLSVSLIIVLVFSGDYVSAWLSAAANTLTFIGVSLTAIFAIIGTSTKYKDDNGNVTAWGKTAIAGAIVSFLVSASTLVVDILKNQREQRDAIARAESQLEANRKLLESIERSVTGFETIGFAFRMDYSDLIPQEYFEIIPRLAPTPTLGLYSGSMVTSATACAEGFPDFGERNLEYLKNALSRIGVFIAVIDDDLASSLVGADGKLKLENIVDAQLPQQIPSYLNDNIEGKGLSAAFSLDLQTLKDECSLALKRLF